MQPHRWPVVDSRESVALIRSGRLDVHLAPEWPRHRVIVPYAADNPLRENLHGHAVHAGGRYLKFRGDCFVTFFINLLTNGADGETRTPTTFAATTSR